MAMVIRTSTLLGSQLQDNPVPQLTTVPAVTLRGNGAHFSIAQDQLTTHLLLIGSTGTGKTNTILHLICQLKRAMRHDDVMLVFDSKLDFSEFHGEDDYVISNCADDKSPLVDWNIFMDIIADGWEKDAIALNADEISAVIFSDHIAKSNQPFFPSAARGIFSAILKAMTFWGISDTDYRIKYLNNLTLNRYLATLDAPKLIEFISGFPELQGVLKYIGSGESDQALGVFAELQSITNACMRRKAFRILTCHSAGLPMRAQIS